LTDSQSIAAGNCGMQFSSWGHISGLRDKGITAYLLLHKQIHFCFSRNCRCLWV